jgi:hypothetical protein
MIASVGALLLLSSPMSVATDLDAAAPARGRWSVSAAVATASAAALPGLSVGGLADGRRRLREGPLFLSVRASWTAASAANETWVINHDELVAAAGLGAEKVAGAGRVWAVLGGGALVLHEALERHQLQRIQMAGVPGGTTSSLAAGPFAYAEVGVGVKLRGPFGGFVSGGPEASRLEVGSGARWHLGGAVRIGVTYDF